jgi:hypothetical protein
MWRVSGSAYNNNLAAAANSQYTSQDDEKFCTLSTAEEFQYPDQECKAEVFLQEIGDLESNDKTCISIAAGGETVTRQCIGDDFGAGILETDWFSGSELFSVELAAMTSIPTERIYHDDVKITCRSCKVPNACSVSCALADDGLLIVTHDTTSGHSEHKCFINDADGCECICKM